MWCLDGKEEHEEEEEASSMACRSIMEKIDWGLECEPACLGLWLLLKWLLCTLGARLGGHSLAVLYLLEIGKTMCSGVDITGNCQ